MDQIAVLGTGKAVLDTTNPIAETAFCPWLLIRGVRRERWPAAGTAPPGPG